MPQIQLLRRQLRHPRHSLNVRNVAIVKVKTNLSQTEPAMEMTISMKTLFPRSRALHIPESYVRKRPNKSHQMQSYLYRIALQLQMLGNEVVRTMKLRSCGLKNVAGSLRPSLT
jgi:hypothetical protein